MTKLQPFPKNVVASKTIRKHTRNDKDIANAILELKDELSFQLDYIKHIAGIMLSGSVIIEDNLTSVLITSINLELSEITFADAFGDLDVGTAMTCFDSDDTSTQSYQYMRGELVLGNDSDEVIQDGDQIIVTSESRINTRTYFVKYVVTSGE